VLELWIHSHHSKCHSAFTTQTSSVSWPVW